MCGDQAWRACLSTTTSRPSPPASRSSHSSSLLSNFKIKIKMTRSLPTNFGTDLVHGVCKTTRSLPMNVGTDLPIGSTGCGVPPILLRPRNRQAGDAGQEEGHGQEQKGESEEGRKSEEGREIAPLLGAAGHALNHTTGPVMPVTRWCASPVDTGRRSHVPCFCLILYTAFDRRSNKSSHPPPRPWVGGGMVASETRMRWSLRVPGAR